MSDPGTTLGSQKERIIGTRPHEKDTTMPLPATYTAKNETGCCPVPNTKGWDGKEVSLSDHFFIRKTGRSFAFIPLNMGKVITTLNSMATEADAKLPAKDALLLSRDLSPWTSEQLYAVSKPIDGADNVVLEGKYLTRVFEGPYADAKHWFKELRDLAQKRGAKDPMVYFFYTTCPKCMKHYGKNYVIGFVRVS